ncbi:MAG TPA: alkaline phosphatase family protein [Actinomycetes bacterium]|nr:alkaline phosphatase family protein [Actinomycetes bacterium]
MTATRPAGPGGRGRSRWQLPDATAPVAGLAAALLGLILCGAVAGGLLDQDGPTGVVDRPTASFVAAHREGWLTGVMRLVTDLGAAAVLVPLVLVAGLVWRWRRGTWRPLALLAGAAAGAWVVQVTVKQLVERPRPPVGLALSQVSGFAFPSGHATDAAAVYGMLAILIAGSTRRAVRVATWAGAAAMVVLVGLSRVYLGVHWLSDVVAGVALGGAWLLAIFTAGRLSDDRVGRVLLATLVVAVLVVAPEVVEGPETPVRAAAAPRGGPTTVVLVIEENHEFGQVIGSPQAPFLNRLAAHGTLLTRYFAVTHPSLPNYVALVAGSPLGIRNDCRLCHRTGRTLVDQLERAHIPWRAYYQGLPVPCSSAVKAGAYANKTNPFAHLDDVRASPARCQRVVPLDRLRPDLRRGRLPRFAVIVPDLQHDMHSGPVPRADAFLRRLYRELAASPSWRPGTVLVVTFDEGTTSQGMRGRGGGRVATIVAGPGVPRRHDPTPYTHYALLRSIEHRFGLPPLRRAADRATRTIPAIAGSR